jgi:hypothetical protein
VVADGPVVPHSLGFEVQALKPMRETPPVSEGDDHDTTGELLLKLTATSVGVPGKEQLVKLGEADEKAVKSPLEFETRTLKLAVAPTARPVKL